MIKKCVILYDEKGQPYSLVEVKDFRSFEEVKAAKKICEENAKAKLEEKRLEKEKADAKIQELENKIAELEETIKMILGEN